MKLKIALGTDEFGYYPDVALPVSRGFSATASPRDSPAPMQSRTIKLAKMEGAHVWLEIGLRVS